MEAPSPHSSLATQSGASKSSTISKSTENVEIGNRNYTLATNVRETSSQYSQSSESPAEFPNPKTLPISGTSVSATPVLLPHNRELPISSGTLVPNRPPDVDNFLAGPSYRTHSTVEEPGQLPLLKPPPLPKSSNDNEQLFLLAQRRAWNDVLRLGLELLISKDSPYQKYYSMLLQGTLPTKEEREQRSDWKEFEKIIKLRIRAMIYLRRFADLRLEVRKLHLLPYQESSEDIPVPLVLEAIESLAHGASSDQSEGSMVGDHVDINGVIDQIYDLRQTLEKEENSKVSILRLDVLLCNILVRKQEWRLALKTLEHILGYVKDAIDTHIKRNMAPYTPELLSAKDMLVSGLRIEIYSRQGKILLQTGALQAAASIFERAHSEYQLIKKKRVEKTEDQQVNGLLRTILLNNAPTQILLNEGLLHFAHMDYELAAEKFQRGIELQRQADASLTFEMNRDSMEEIMLPEQELLVSCLNNFALCAMYTCRMRDAVSMMEALIRENPTRYLTDCLTFNLCTLYELGSDNTVSDSRKKTLQLVAKRFSLHDIGNDSFRLVK